MKELTRNPVPDWVPEPARMYLSHVVDGIPIRALARAANSHPSTVLRRIRRYEQLRDDPLVDDALHRLGRRCADPVISDTQCGADRMKMTKIDTPPSEHLIASEAKRVLRRLSEPGACLAVAHGMEKAVVVREGKDGQTVRTGTVDTTVAEAMALKGWIAASGNGKIARYRIKPAGQIALRDLLARADSPEAPPEDRDPRGMRYGTVESPLMMLARRRDKDGNVFLTDDLVRAGERLREDFELAGMSNTPERNWEDMMHSADAPAMLPGAARAHGADAARTRVHAVMQDLGPGLGDVVLRACCHLEGMESIEKRMGWAARSGKIVLRIGLQRLQRHFRDTQGTLGPMIG